MQEYWSGLPFPSPGDRPDPGMELKFSVSPALQVDSLSLSYQGIPKSGLVMPYNPFYMLMALVCLHCVEDFCVYIEKAYCSLVFLFWDIFAWLWYQRNTGFIE